MAQLLYKDMHPDEIIILPVIDTTVDYDMQSVGSNIEFNCPNSQCRCAHEEVQTLRQQVRDLSRTVDSLENTIQLKDTQLECVRRDKERLSAELKKQQRSNRNIKQQLDDERFFYQREKDYFTEEIERQKTRCGSNSSKFQQQRKRELEAARDTLSRENYSLREELSEKSETTYNLCIKFLRMKHAKDGLRQRLDQLLREHLQVMAEMMEKLDEARNELNVIVSEKFQEPLPLSKAKFLQIVQRNTRLVHENAALKVQIQHLTLNIDKLRSSTQRPRSINVDARIIAKLATQGRKKSFVETQKWLLLPSDAKETEGSVSLTKSASTNLREPVDHSGDAKLLSKIRSRNSKKYVSQEVREAPSEVASLTKEFARSVPEMTRTKMEELSLSTISADQTDLSIGFHDASTNT